MSSQNSSPIALIGAGLGGLTLAIALKQIGINVKIYELRGPDYDFGGAIMLSPNALRVLDALHVYERIRNKGYNFETLVFKTDKTFDYIGTYFFGEEKQYGYKALRIYRNVLIAELRQMVAEQGIPIEYHRKFTHVVSEDVRGVTFAFADGSTESAHFLIGTDGIHSKVREYLDPSMVAKYSGWIGVTYAFPKCKLRFPGGQEMHLPVSLMGPNGAYVLAPQNPDGEEILAGRQFKVPLQERQGWDALGKNLNELTAMHQGDMDSWSDFANSGQEQIDKPEAHGHNIWPFHTVPKLEKWSSEIGKVIIMGDAAHAIPPTAGQGANQAFEDSYSLATLLKMVEDGEVELKPGLIAWQNHRQGRVEKVLELSDQMNNMRLSGEEKAKLPKEKVWHDQTTESGEGGQLGWLYLPDIQKDMKDVVAKVKAA